MTVQLGTLIWERLAIYAMKLPTFAWKLRTVTGLLHSWPLESKQKKIGDF